MNRFTVVLLCTATTLLAQSSSTIQFYDSLGVTKTARFGWQGAPTTGKFFIETPSDNAQNVTVDKGELTAKKVSGDGSGLTNVVPKDGSVTGEKIGVSAVDSTKIGADAVVTAKIKNGAVDSNKIGPGAVVTAKIKDKAVTDAKIDSVSWGKISGKPVIPSGVVGDGSVDSGKIASNAITTNKIKDGAVTNAKIDSVNWTKISNKPSLLIAGNAIDSITARTIVTTGNVGIGTINPTSKLEVNGKIKAPYHITHSSDSDVFSYGTDNIHQYGLSPFKTQTADLSVALSGYEGLGLFTNSALRMFIGANGFIGIANSNPGVALEVNGNIRSNSAFISDYNSITSYYGVGAFGAGTSAIGTLSNHPFNIATNNTVRMSVNSNGNIGIGSNPYAATLHVDKSAIGALGGTLFITNTATATVGNKARLGFDLVSFDDIDPTASIDGVMKRTNGTSDLVFNLYDGSGSLTNYEKMRILGSNGNVGIGESNPSYKLTVAGTTYCSGGTWAGSDRRFKLSITPLDSSLSKITRLQGVYYLWDTKKFPERNFDTTKQIGLIAQDVEKIIPEVVHTAKDGYKSLSYDKLTAVLIEAVKEQQKQIESSQKQIELQQKQSELQQKQINELRAEIKNGKK